MKLPFGDVYVEYNKDLPIVGLNGQMENSFCMSVKLE